MDRFFVAGIGIAILASYALLVNAIAQKILPTLTTDDHERQRDYKALVFALHFGWIIVAVLLIAWIAQGKPPWCFFWYCGP